MHKLRVRGVLVLIQQDHLVAGSLGLPDLSMPAADPGRKRHLVAVVDHLPGRLGRRVGSDQREQLVPGPLGLKHVGDGLRHPAGQARGAVRQPPAGLAHVLRAAQMLGQFARPG